MFDVSPYFTRVEYCNAWSFVIIKPIPGYLKLFEPAYDKANKIACASSEDSDQPGNPLSLIRLFAVRSTGR